MLYILLNSILHEFDNKILRLCYQSDFYGFLLSKESLIFTEIL